MDFCQNSWEIEGFLSQNSWEIEKFLRSQNSWEMENFLSQNSWEIEKFLSQNSWRGGFRVTCPSKSFLKNAEKKKHPNPTLKKKDALASN
jgi:hypothetical protein